MHLTRVFEPERYRRGLHSWTWIGLEGKVPFLSSVFGDLFLQADDGVWFLDTLAGTLTRPWSNRQELRATLATPQGQDRYLLADLAEEAGRAGLEPDEREVFDFVTPPMLGGRMEVGNLTVLDFVVSVGTAGELHHEAHYLGAGSARRSAVPDDPAVA